MKNSNAFLTEIGELCDRHGRTGLKPQLRAVAIAALPQLLRVEHERITHASHPLRVFRHLLVALAEQPLMPRVELALAISCMCHDLSTVKKKSSTYADRRSHDMVDTAARAAEERSRRFLRLLHEAEGVAELVRAVIAANALLEAEGEGVIDADVLEIAARVCAVHDTPSLRTKLPLDPGHPAGQALAVFVQADGIAMIEFDQGLKSHVPVGPMIELWARGEPRDREKVAAQVSSSIKSLQSRLQAAFELKSGTSLKDCFANRALGELADRYVSDWQAELRSVS